MWIGEQPGAVWRRPGLKHLTGYDAKCFCLSILYLHQLYIFLSELLTNRELFFIVFMERKEKLIYLPENPFNLWGGVGDRNEINVFSSRTIFYCKLLSHFTEVIPNQEQSWAN